MKARVEAAGWFYSEKLHRSHLDILRASALYSGEEG